MATETGQGTHWRTKFPARGRLLTIGATLLLGTAAPAPLRADAVYHQYDSLGRLTRVCNMLPNDGERTDYDLDLADNRKGYANTKTDIALWPGSAINSPDGRFSLTFQSDGNLVLYRNSDRAGIWATMTNGSGANCAYFQPDGNFIVYTPTGQSVWRANSTIYPCAQIAVTNRGSVEIRSMDNQVVWQAGPGDQ